MPTAPQGVAPSAQEERSTTEDCVLLLVLLHPLRERSDQHPLKRSRLPLAYRFPKVVVQYQPYLELLL